MLRVSGQELKSYLGLEETDTTDLSIFLDLGNMLVEDELLGKGLSVNRLKMIELNLDAHYATLSIEKGGMVQQSVGLASETYQQERMVKPNFSRTRFGQQAIALDTSGTLSSMNAPLGKAEFRVLHGSKDTPYPYGPFVG